MNFFLTAFHTFLTAFHTIFYQPIYNVLMIIYAGLHSFPVALVVMTLLFRVLLIPLYMKQLASSKSMQEIGPLVQEIQRKYRSEPQVLQAQLNALYKEHGVNPYMGCLPLVVQLPFIYGLYGAFNTVLNAATKQTVAPLNADMYPFVRGLFGGVGLTTFPNLNFLWLNLGHPDPLYILPVVAGVGTFVQIRMSMARNRPKPKPGAPADPNAASMQMMQYIMPAFTLFIALRFSAGIALYWSITTLFTIGQQYFVNGRSWGSLVKGIPGLDPELRPALAVANGAALDATSRRGAPRARVVVDATPAAPRALPALPAARPGKTPKAVEPANLIEDEATAENTTEEPAAPRSPAPQPAAPPKLNPSRAIPPKSGVKLVPATTNGAGIAKPIMVAGAKPRPGAASVKTRPNGSMGGQRPIVKTTTRPRKGGR